MALVTRRNFVLPGLDTAAQIVWLKERLGWVNNEIVTGKVNDKWNASDAGGEATIDLNLPAEKRRDLILNDLSILDPTNYPPRDTVRVKRTVPRYLCWFVVGCLSFVGAGCTTRGGWPRFAEIKLEKVRPHPGPLPQEREL